VSIKFLHSLFVRLGGFLLNSLCLLQIITMLKISSMLKFNYWCHYRHKFDSYYTCSPFFLAFFEKPARLLFALLPHLEIFPPRWSSTLLPTFFSFLSYPFFYKKICLNSLFQEEKKKNIYCKKSRDENDQQFIINLTSFKQK